MKDGIALERSLFFPLYDTKGMQEGVSAFVEKRKPNMKDLWSNPIIYLLTILL